MTSYATEQQLTTTIHISSTDIYRTKNIDGLILHKLKSKIEGFCGRSGYVIPDSTHIVQRSTGTIQTLDGKNVTEFDLTYTVNTIHPKKDDVYECIIDSITKMGLIAYLDISGHDTKSSPILFIIPQEYIGEKELDSFSEGQKIEVTILEIRVKYRATQIQAVARLN